MNYLLSRTLQSISTSLVVGGEDRKFLFLLVTIYTSVINIERIIVYLYLCNNCIAFFKKVKTVIISKRGTACFAATLRDHRQKSITFHTITVRLLKGILLLLNCFIFMSCECFASFFSCLVSFFSCLCEEHWVNIQYECAAYMKIPCLALWVRIILIKRNK